MGAAASHRRCGIWDFDGYSGRRVVSHLERQIDAVALYTPILGLNAMIARHFGAVGPSRNGFRGAVGSAVVSELTSVIDPLAVDPTAPPQRRLIVGAWHDRMAMREPTDCVAGALGRPALYWYDGPSCRSHVSPGACSGSRAIPSAAWPMTQRSGDRRAMQTAREVVRASYNLRGLERMRTWRWAEELMGDTVSGTRSGRRTP